MDQIYSTHSTKVLSLRSLNVLKPRMAISGATSDGLLPPLGLFAKLLMAL